MPRFNKKNKIYFIDTRILRNDGTNFHFVYPTSSDLKKMNSAEIEKFKSKRYVNSIEFETIEKKRQTLMGVNSNINSLEQLFNHYIRSISFELAENTLANKEYAFNKYIKPFFANYKNITQILTPKNCADFRAHLTTVTALSTASKNGKLTLFVELVDYARKVQVINSDTKDDCMYNLTKIKGRVVQKSEQNKYTPVSDLSKILDVCEDKNFQVATRILYFSGLRFGEFLGMKVKDLDFVGDKIRINISRQRLANGTLVETLKTTESYKTIILSEQNADVLKEYITSNSLDLNDLLFNYSRTYFRKRLNGLFDLANVARNTLHGFGRKSINTELYLNGADIKVRQTLLGQASGEVNIKHYIDKEVATDIGGTILEKIRA